MAVTFRCFPGLINYFNCDSFINVMKKVAVPRVNTNICIRNNVLVIMSNTSLSSINQKTEKIITNKPTNKEASNETHIVNTNQCGTSSNTSSRSFVLPNRKLRRNIPLNPIIAVEAIRAAVTNPAVFSILSKPLGLYHKKGALLFKANCAKLIAIHYKGSFIALS